MLSITLPTIGAFAKLPMVRISVRTELIEARQAYS